MKVMGVKLLVPKRAMAMRSPLGRALFAALVLVLVLVALVRPRGLPAPSRVFGFKPPPQPDQPPDQPPDHPDQQQPQQQQHALPVARPPMAPVSPDAPARGYLLNCSLDMDRLDAVRQRYQLDDKFQYLRRYVRFARRPGLARQPLTRLAQALLPSPGAVRTVDVARRRADADDADADSCAPPLDVDVPVSGLPASVNASDFMFGVSTTYRRFSDAATTPIHEWLYWLTDGRGRSNGAKLLLVLLDADDDQLQEVANLLGDAGIDVDVYHSDSSVPMAVRYITLVPTLFTHPNAPSKKWLVTCDDDTFFPSMHALIRALARYDHRRHMYVGTLSEDVFAVERHGSQAFGGAGVFLSRSLAQRVTDLYASCTSDHKVRESDSGWGPQGDILLRKCIYENTDTRLSQLWDLWQLDFYGDPSGFYEWGIQPLSLHHYRGGGWHKAKPRQYTTIAHTCGEDCSFMRFQTSDDFILSGYSIAHYPEGITFDANQMEATLWAAPENKGWNLDFMFGPQRPSLDKTGRKIAWHMQESDVQPDGSVIQTYTRKKDDARWAHPDGRPMSSIDGVFELVWIPDL